MQLASLLETKTGITHQVRDPSQALWDIAVRKQKKRGLPDKTRFSLWARCGTRLRANSLTTSQTVTCITCLMQTQEEEDDASYWTKPQHSWLVHRIKHDPLYTWTNQYMGYWVPSS